MLKTISWIACSPCIATLDKWFCGHWLEWHASVLAYGFSSVEGALYLIIISCERLMGPEIDHLRFFIFFFYFSSPIFRASNIHRYARNSPITSNASATLIPSLYHTCYHSHGLRDVVALSRNLTHQLVLEAIWAASNTTVGFMVWTLWCMAIN